MTHIRVTGTPRAHAQLRKHMVMRPTIVQVDGYRTRTIILGTNHMYVATHEQVLERDGDEKFDEHVQSLVQCLVTI